jgi:hypothetical protein
MSSIRLQKSLFFQIVLLTFYVLLILKNYVESEGTLQKILTVSYIILGILMSLHFYAKLKRNSAILFFMSLMILAALLTSVLGENYRLEDIILMFTYYGVAFIPLLFKLNYKLFLGFVYVQLFFFIISIIREVNPNELFNVSRNFVSVVLLIGLSLYIISCVQNQRHPNFFVILLSFIISIWATGRGGIISIALILITYPFILKIRKWYKFLILFFLIIFTGVVYSYFEDILFQFGLGRFSSMGLVDVRSEINADYLEESLSSIRYILFGTPLSKIPLIVELDNNPHNSFIRLHIFYGLVGLIFLFFAVIYSIIHYLKAKNFFFMILLIALLVRSYVDSTSFHGPLDPLIFFFLFYALKDRSFKKDKKQIIYITEYNHEM